jgi:hypothetical protein
MRLSSAFGSSVLPVACGAAAIDVLGDGIDDDAFATGPELLEEHAASGVATIRRNASRRIQG